MKNTNADAKTPIEEKNARHARRVAWAFRIMIFVAFATAVSFILAFERDMSFSSREFIVGEPASRSLFAPLNISYVDNEATDLLRLEKSRGVIPVLRLDPAVGQEIRYKIDRFFLALDATKGVLPGNEKTKINMPFEISEGSVNALMNETSREEAWKRLEELIEKSLAEHVLDDRLKSDFVNAGIDRVAVVNTNAKTEETLAVKDLLTLEDIKKSASGVLRSMIPKDRDLRDAVQSVFNGTMTSNLVLDEAELKSRRLKAAETVEPVKKEIKKNELLVQRGMLVTEPMKTRLNLMQKGLAKQRVIHKLLTVGILAFLTYLLGFLYLMVFEKRTFASFRLILLIHTAIFTTVVLCKVVVLWPGSTPYLMPVSLAALLLAMLINYRIAVLSAIAVSILIAPITQFGADIHIAALLSSVAGVFAAMQIRKRIHFVKVGVVIGVTYFLVTFAYQLFQEYSVREALLIGIQGFANGLLITTPIAFLLLPIFESVFDCVTDITLLELSDLNHPLLKRMMVEAPGTYHHSLVVSTLAESACEAIGANALLARVGCYFHDIGKISHAEFFSENEAKQAAGHHEKLTPTMSCLIIMNHIKDGLELGRRYHLRRPILDFICEHQGNSVIYYFYKKAIGQAQSESKINPDDFRYPGPKPQSREVAIALLADSAEAASRSLEEPTPESVRDLVRKVINDKFIDGQLDECNLTLRDLHKIQESFECNLMAIFHTRVNYPDHYQHPDKPDLFKGNQFSKFRVEP
ncbi:MAG: HDIG domain-containing protein [Candidatus Omnitrophica bacterium]|nr:HDIG domain-containing protein [Candidatus Omnitrophota bacterium]MDD5671353.1 HDIG domain-containing protein [Candidatus Omnitrophota bacterium]